MTDALPQGRRDSLEQDIRFIMQNIQVAKSLKQTHLQMRLTYMQVERILDKMFDLQDEVEHAQDALTFISGAKTIFESRAYTHSYFRHLERRLAGDEV